MQGMAKWMVVVMLLPCSQEANLLSVNEHGTSKMTDSRNKPRQITLTIAKVNPQTQKLALLQVCTF